MAALIFWGCFTLLAWTFLLYPVGMLARAGLVRRGWVEGPGSRPRPLAGPSQLVASTSLVASRLVLAGIIACPWCCRSATAPAG